MKKFIKITQTNNQTTYINILNIIKFYRSNAETVTIVTTDSDKIECKQTLDELVKLIDDASAL